MTIHRVALIGATGNLGQIILRDLLDDGFEVTILSRQAGAPTNAFSNHSKQRILQVDFEDVDSLVSALQGLDAVISNIAGAAIRSQRTLIDASLQCGIRRFIPSEFGMDLDVPANQTVPFYQPKLDIAQYLARSAQTHPTFSYTRVVNGLFLDWALKHSILADLHTHTATLWDGGSTKVSATTLASTSKAVIGILKNPDATKNKVIRIQDATVTQAQIIAIAKGINGKPWRVSHGDTAVAYKAGCEELEKPEPDMRFAIFNQLYRTLFSVEHRPCLEDRLDNELLGLPLMTEEQLRDVVEAYMR